MKISIFFLSFFYSCFLFATDHNIKTKFAYNFYLNHHDDGLNDKKDAYSQFDYKNMRIGFSGNVSKDLMFEVELNTPGDVSTDHIELTYTKFDFMKVVFGNPKAMIYGWRQKLDGPMDYLASASASLSPIGREKAVKVVVHNAIGDFSVMSMNDAKPRCSTEGSCQSWSKEENSYATSAEWIGSFGSFQPLLQYGLYDLGHSSTMTLGVRFSESYVDAQIDYIADKRSNKGADVNGQPEDQFDNLTGVNVTAELKFGALSPYVHYSTYQKKDYTPEGSVEKKFNSGKSFDDNKTAIALGLSANILTDHMSPYIVYIDESGDFGSDNSNVKSLSLKTLKVGLKGSW